MKKKSTLIELIYPVNSGNLKMLSSETHILLVRQKMGAFTHVSGRNQKQDGVAERNSSYIPDAPVGFNDKYFSICSRHSSIIALCY